MYSRRLETTGDQTMRWSAGKPETMQMGAAGKVRHSEEESFCGWAAAWRAAASVPRLVVQARTKCLIRTDCLSSVELSSSFSPSAASRSRFIRLSSDLVTSFSWCSETLSR